MRTSSLVLFLLFFSTSAFAVEKYPVERLTKLAVNGDKVSVAYISSAGCMQHKPEFKIELSVSNKLLSEKNWKQRVIAELVVVDTSETFDDCETGQLVEGIVDVKALVTKTIKSSGLKLKSDQAVEILIPQYSLLLPVN